MQYIFSKRNIRLFKLFLVSSWLEKLVVSVSFFSFIYLSFPENSKNPYVYKNYLLFRDL